MLNRHAIQHKIITLCFLYFSCADSLSKRVVKPTLAHYRGLPMYGLYEHGARQSG
jgi:hypothetical protein